MYSIDGSTARLFFCPSFRIIVTMRAETEFDAMIKRYVRLIGPRLRSSFPSLSPDEFHTVACDAVWKALAGLSRLPHVPADLEAYLAVSIRHAAAKQAKENRLFSENFVPLGDDL